MSYIGNDENETKEKTVNRHTISTDPIVNLSRVEDAMSLVHGMKKETSFVMKQGAVHQVVDPTYSENGTYHAHNEMIFLPEDLNNQLANEYLNPEQNDINYIKSLSFEEKKELLKQLEKMENKKNVVNKKKSKRNKYDRNEKDYSYSNSKNHKKSKYDSDKYYKKKV